MIKNHILIILFFSYSLEFLHGQDKVCDESIALEIIENESEKLNTYNNIVKEVLKKIIIKSDNSDFVSRDNLGDLAAFYEDEENIREAFSFLAPEKLLLFVKKDISYVGFISTRKATWGAIECAITKIELFNTFTGNPTIILEVQYTIDEIFSDDIMYKRVIKEFSKYSSCNEIDGKIASLQKKLVNEEDKMTDFIKDQENACAGLEVAYNNYNARKQKKLQKNYESLVVYLDKQKIICGKLDPIIKNIKQLKRDLRDAENEKIEYEKKNSIPPVPVKIEDYVEFYQKDDKVDVPITNSENKPSLIEKASISSYSNVASRISPKTPVTENYNIGKELRPKCLKNSFFITPKEAFVQKFSEYYFVQFASLPLEGYAMCEFKAFYAIGAPAIYLVDKGEGYNDETRHISLIGPFYNREDCQQALNVINQFRDYEDSFIFNP